MNDCVNMETKTCFFGYGGIIVDGFFQSMKLIGIKPPLGTGSKFKDSYGNKIGDWEYTGSILTIEFNNLKEIQELYIMLDYIDTKKGGSFKFKEVVFNFTTYEKVSVEIVRSVVDMIKRSIISVSAC